MPEHTILAECNVKTAKVKQATVVTHGSFFKVDITSRAGRNKAQNE